MELRKRAVAKMRELLDRVDPPAPATIANPLRGDLASLTLPPHVRTQLKAIVARSEPPPNRYVMIPSLFDGATEWLALCEGLELRNRFSDANGLLDEADRGTCLKLLLGIRIYLDRVAGGPDAALLRVRPADYEDAVNLVLSDAGIPLHLNAKGWRETIHSELETVRRILLLGHDEAAGCRQGDVQVEMVASTVQRILGTPGAVVVDFGCGYGRVLAGLTTAPLFRQVTYVAVDEPISKEMRTLAEGIDGSRLFDTRDSFLASEIRADLILVVNTLHHIPFDDIPRQLSGMLRRLSQEGQLLIHDLGRFAEPEQRRVPWPGAYIELLFRGGCFEVNRRDTVSSRGYPISNVLVSRRPEANHEHVLRDNVRAVWERMKADTLAEIDDLYRSADPNAHAALHHALIRNANLDLNPPGHLS